MLVGGGLGMLEVDSRLDRMSGLASNYMHWTALPILAHDSEYSDQSNIKLSFLHNSCKNGKYPYKNSCKTHYLDQLLLL